MTVDPSSWPSLLSKVSGPVEPSGSGKAAVTIACVKWGTKYNSDYVNKLAAGVRRHLTVPYRFVCFTDDASGISADIVTQALPEAAHIRVQHSDSCVPAPHTSQTFMLSLAALDAGLVAQSLPILGGSASDPRGSRQPRVVH